MWLFVNKQHIRKTFSIIKSLLCIAALGALLYCANTWANESDQGITVQMTVPAAGGSSPPGSTPESNNPPIIFNVTVTTTYTTALVTWAATDDAEVTSVSFDYGLTTSYASSSVPTGSYQVNVSGLATNTLYYYRIRASDALGATAEHTGSFRTLADLTPPVINNVRVSPGVTTATVRWDTNEPADSQVNYGFTSSYSSTALDLVYKINHSLMLFSLLPSTTYHYRIISTDTSGNSAATGDAVFTTNPDDIPPPNVTNVSLTTSTSAIIVSWTNPSLASVPDFVGVRVLRKVGSSSANPSDGTVVYQGSAETLTDSSVLVNVTYYYTIFSYDTSGNFSSGVFRSGRLVPATPSEICTNGVDDDSDGLVDCSDSTCALAPSCVLPTGEICNNGIDDNANGFVDCADAACATSPACIAPAVEVCTNGLDDDSDGAVDCSDSDCSGSAFCGVGLPAEICNNTVDDDSDAAVDCFDSDCSGFSGCVDTVVPACTDGADNDADGFVDFPDDPGCTNGADADEYNPPEETVPVFEQLGLDDARFFGGNGRILLVLQGNRVTSLAGSGLMVVIAEQSLSLRPESMTLRVGDGGQHQFTYNATNQTYYVSLSFPPVGQTQAYIEVTYGSGQLDVLEFTLQSEPWGDVLGTGDQRLADVELTLKDAGGQLVSMGMYGQANPLYTDPNGSYGWVVPNGDYYLSARRQGYVDRDRIPVRVADNVMNERVVLIQRPLELAAVIDPNASLARNAQNIAKNLIEKTKVLTEITIQEIQEKVDDPVVERAAERVVAPTAIGVVVVSAVPFISWLDFIPFLRLLFLQPLMFLGWRRREKWGLVYNALSKMPVDLAIVRLLDAQTGRVVQSKVTDAQGRYVFLVDPGRYRIEVQKNNFIFPSQLLKGFKSDGRRADIYHGEGLEVTERHVSITANIPLDPVGAVKRPARLLLERIGRKLQFALSMLGIVFTAISLYISPKWYIAALLVLHIVLLAVFRRLAMPPKVRNWGIVYDETDKKPVGRAVARLFNAKFNKLVATQITDSKGRYHFLAGDDTFYVTLEHKQYRPHRTNEINLEGKDIDVVAPDVELKRH